MLTEYFRQEPLKKEEIVWDQPVLLRPQRIPRQIPSAEQKGAAQCGKDRKKQTDLRHFRLLEALYCHIPGQKRRTDIVTEGKQVFSFGRRNFPFISQVRAGFCPYWKATEKSTDHRKRSIFRNAKKRLQNWRKGMVDQEMLSVRIIRPVIRRKGKSTGSTFLYQSSSPFAAPVATVSGEKASEGKVRSENTDSFFVFIVYTCRILCNSL